jgi:hypothetical protein
MFSKDLLDGKPGKYKLNKDLIKEGSAVFLNADRISGVFKEYSDKELRENPDGIYTSEKHWKQQGILLD